MKRRDFLAASAGLAGSVLPVLSRAQTRPCPPSPVSVDGGQGSTTVCIQGDAEADWQERISGAGVVWFHDFRTDDEVNNFRWTPGYGNGNDPLAVGSAYAKYVRRITTDGITGGGCLEIFRQAGSNDGSDWWRPFSPLPLVVPPTNGEKGRHQSDPSFDPAGRKISRHAPPVMPSVVMRRTYLA